jgi:hypothetical protein
VSGTDLVADNPVPARGTRSTEHQPMQIPQNAESPAGAGLSGEADEGTRTLDLLHGKQTL